MYGTEDDIFGELVCLGLSSSFRDMRWRGDEMARWCSTMMGLCWEHLQKCHQKPDGHPKYFAAPSALLGDNLPTVGNWGCVWKIWRGWSGNSWKCKCKGWGKGVFCVRHRLGKEETAERWDHGARSEEWNLLEHQKCWIKSYHVKAAPKERENTGDEGRSQFNRLEIWLDCRNVGLEPS